MSAPSWKRAADPDPVAVGIGEHELAQPVVLLGDRAGAVDAEIAQLFPQFRRVGDLQDTPGGRDRVLPPAATPTVSRRGGPPTTRTRRR